MLYLADTSLWIEWLRKDSSTVLQKEEWLEVVVCPPVIQELLQGISSSRQKEIFKERLLAFFCVEKSVSTDLYIAASDIYSACREKGVKIRSSTDCLIAAIAIKNKLPIKHRDRDYDLIAKVTSLKIVK